MSAATPAWTFNADVVSPQFPCGAAWLANALIELGVHLRELWGFDTAGEWHASPGGGHRYVAEHLPWRQTLASLRPGRSFSVDPALRPRFSHQFPWQLDICPKLVLMVRDPRDALHSEWRRHLSNEGLPQDVGLVEFTRMPFFGGPVSIAQMLFLHLHCWLAMRVHLEEAVLLVRFEDWKRTPVAVLDRVTRWLGAPRDMAALQRAAVASDVTHLLAIEQQVVQEQPQARRFNRLGHAEEWRSAWRPEWDAALGPHWRAVFAALGYERPGGAAQAALDVDIAQFLAWRGVSEPAQQQHWRDMCRLDGLEQGAS